MIHATATLQDKVGNAFTNNKISIPRWSIIELFILESYSLTISSFMELNIHKWTLKIGVCLWNSTLTINTEYRCVLWNSTPFTINTENRCVLWNSTLTCEHWKYMCLYGTPHSPVNTENRCVYGTPQSPGTPHSPLTLKIYGSYGTPH